MSVPLVSVVVPVYNVETYLERCVRSVLAQTFSDFELLLIDDGSTDQSGAMCDAFAEEDARIRVIHKPNGGLSDARNVGIEAAKGEYIEFVDSDDYLEPESLDVLVGLIREYDCDIAAGGVADCYEGKRVPQHDEIKIFVCPREEALDKILQGTHVSVSACGKLIAKQLLETRRFPVGKTYEDAFFMPELAFCSTMVITTQSLYNYWHRQNSITTSAFSDRCMDVIGAYQKSLSLVRENCPSLLPLATFRVYWAHFVVLDRMMATKNYRKLPQYKGVVSFLKKNWLNIVKCPYFQSSRRMAAVMLKINAGLYYLLSCIKRRQDGIHA